MTTANVGPATAMRALHRLSLLAACLSTPVAQSRNLAPNPSFEYVEDDVPAGWTWQKGRADGELRIDTQIVHEGAQSVFIRNSTPQAPHVYSGLRAHIPVHPGTVYTLSAFVRSTDPGAAWIGGGKGWHVRLPVPVTGEAWSRVVKTFATGPDERTFDLIINTDSPTPGFWVDTVQLEEGSEATAYAPPPPPGHLELQRLPPEASPLGENLIANGSFEMIDGARPKNWSWDRRNTDATFTIAPDAHSGASAIRITNSTATAPHVYGHVVLQGGLRLEPGEAYTLSFFANSETPGPAWVGGGDGWWMRLPIGETAGEWKRFIRTFTARDGDVSFPLMVNTDGPTPGFTVDDIKLEKGTIATPFFDPTLASESVCLHLDVPARVSCSGSLVRFPAVVHVLEAAGEVPVSCDIEATDGSYRTDAHLAESLTPGIIPLVLAWTPPNPPATHYTVRLRAGTASTENSFELFTNHRFASAREEAVARRDELRLAIANALAASLPTNYARAALAVTNRFLRIAGTKRNRDLIPEAVADAHFLAELCAAEARALGRTKAGEDRPKQVPDPPLSEMTIRDGSFRVKGKPVMLVGGLGYGELLNELGTYRDYGFNVIGDDFNSYSAFSMLTGEGEFDQTAIPRLRKSWDELERLNLAIAYNPTLHYFPVWALKQYPDITGGYPVDRLPDWSGLGRHKGQRVKSYGAFFPFAIDSQDLRRLVSTYYAELMPQLRPASPFHVIWLMNEPTYDSRDPHYLQLFRESLARQYGTVEALNAAWPAQFADFAAVEPNLQPGTRARFDWLAYHQDQVASWFEWLAEEIKHHHPAAHLSNKPMAWTFLHPDRGIDFEREAELWDIPGCDAGRSPRSSRYAFDWRPAVMLFDFQKSVAPGKPLADHEYHYVHEPDVTAEYVRATYFHSYFHGLRMSQFWVWATGLIGEGQAGAGMRHTAWSQPRVAWGTASSALDLRRLAPYVAAFPQTPDVAVYISRPSLYLHTDTYRKAICSAYEAAALLDAPIGFLTDRMIRRGKLPTAKLLILPNDSRLEPDIGKALEAFAAKGGHILTVGRCLTWGPAGDQDRRAVAGPAERVHRIEELDRSRLDEAFSRADVQRPVRALTAAGDLPEHPVECRAATVDGETVCYVLGLNKEAQDIRLLSAGQPVKAWQDLISGASGTAAAFRIEPLDVRLLVLER